MNAAPAEDDDETVSVKSFETCVMPEEAHVPIIPTVAHPSDAHNTADDPEHDRVPGEQSHVIVPAEPASWKEGAATMIQSAFRGFMV